MTTTNTGHAIATITLEQIGRRAMFMIGAGAAAYDKSGSVSFKIGRNGKRVTHIRVTLDPSDTYTVKFTKEVPYRFNQKTCKYTSGYTKTLAEVSDVYSDMLCSVIETHTDMRTSL